MWLADVALVLGLTLRLIRLVVCDDIGERYIRQPAENWAGASPVRRWWTDALGCPYCVGFWIGCLSLFSLFLAGGPGHADMLWRYTAGAFALNWVAGHITARMDT